MVLALSELMAFNIANIHRHDFVREWLVCRRHMSRTEVQIQLLTAENVEVTEAIMRLSEILLGPFRGIEVVIKIFPNRTFQFVLEAKYIK